ncbi:hypothetical protein B0H34DRAFT_369673 [Crassisporium funariophilum]|nr:hypothetical protein B0H34DRAFT_369673 [Crassisporium funariophilum]
MSISHSLDRLMLAQELLEHIFTFLDPVTDHRSRSALRRCAYASPSLCIISQKRLFYEVILDHTRDMEDSPPTVSFKRLAFILDTSPHIAAYIRSLKIMCFESPYVDPDDFMTRGYESSCLASLANLQEISLSANTKSPLLRGSTSRVMWGSIFPDTQTALLDVIASSSLTRLDISGVLEFPATFFHTLPDSLASLKHLSLSQLRFSDPSSQTEIPPFADRLPSNWFSSQPTGFKYPQLDSLSFEDLSDMKLTMRSSGGKVFAVDVKDISRLLRLCAGSLEDLHMDVNEEPGKSALILLCNDEDGGPKLSTTASKIVPPINGEFQMPALKYLTFYGKIHEVDGLDPTAFCNPFPWIMDFLRNLSLPTSTSTTSTAFSVSSGHCGIQNIRLNIFLEQRWDTNLLKAVDWVDAAATITENNFPALVKLEINILGVGDHHTLGQQTLRRNRALGKLEEKGILQFSWCKDYQWYTCMDKQLLQFIFHRIQNLQHRSN